nr:HD domain-containing protein [uncultured Methanospirillum sp.]
MNILSGDPGVSVISIPGFKEVGRFVEDCLQAHGAHGLDHTLRVTALCDSIGRREGADMQTLIPAALLHDIARPLEESKGVPHEEEGARIAEEFLISIRYPPEKIRGITHAILTHRYRSTRDPETLEAKILSDADKLDAMGAVGIARAFMTAGERGGEMQDAILHIDDKLLNLKPLMYTRTGQDMARERHQVLKRFREIYLNETRLISPEKSLSNVA